MMPRKTTPNLLADLDGSRANDPAGASVAAMFGPAASGRIDLPLDLISDNPFQERSEYGDLTDLANDIREHGLLQPPVVRPIAGGRYELAFGHRRRRACELAGMTSMPAVVRQLTDEQMATIAFSENEQRADVTAIDKAQAIQAMQARFGWSLQQIADKLSMSRPAVSNLLRLLKLPDDVQAAVVAGQVSARQAEAVLALLEIPEKIRQASEHEYTGDIKASQIVRDALTGGVSSDVIRQRTARMLSRHATPIHEQRWYKLDLPIDGVEAPACQQCAHALKRDSGVYCTGPAACRTTKHTWWCQQDLAPAAAAVGLLPAQPPYGAYTELSGYHAEPLWQKLLAGETCPHDNIRVMHKARQRWEKPPWPEYPNAEPICYHGENHKCKCLLAIARAQTASGQSNKTSSGERKRMMAAAVPILAAALEAVPVPVLRAFVGGQIDSQLTSHESRQLDDAAYIVVFAERLVSRLINDWSSPNYNRGQLTERFLAAGLRDPFALVSQIAPGSDSTFPTL
jgi:ParB family chromosome partitioning protein